MQFNLHPKVRFALYVITSLAGIWLAFFADAQLLSEPLLKAIGLTVAFVGGLAGYNLNGAK